MHVEYTGLSEDRIVYIKRLAYRYAAYRRSAVIDADDLISGAMMRWWEFSQHRLAALQHIPEDILFRQQVKFSMRDQVRNSEVVKVSRSYRAKLEAYEAPYAVSLDNALHVQTQEQPVDPDLWLDVVDALKLLSEREQLVLSLSIEQGYTFTEIAYAMDVAVSTVTRQYHGAVAKIKKSLQQSPVTRKKEQKSTDSFHEGG